MDGAEAGAEAGPGPEAELAASESWWEVIYGNTVEVLEGQWSWILHFRPSLQQWRWMELRVMVSWPSSWVTWVAKRTGDGGWLG